jgi:hypothetical protein
VSRSPFEIWSANRFQDQSNLVSCFINVYGMPCGALGGGKIMKLYLAGPPFSTSESDDLGIGLNSGQSELKTD